jgi:TRAP-type C4-dicarboxylate transport system substrate-binding protein
MNHITPWLRTLAALAVTSSISCVNAQDLVTYKVIGQPVATGKIQSIIEKPFFDEFAKRTGLPIAANYKPSDQLGLKDTEQLRIMKAGLFDIVSLRMSANSRDEPTLLGMDLVGAAPNYATARKVYDAWLDTLDKAVWSTDFIL